MIMKNRKPWGHQYEFFNVPLSLWPKSVRMMMKLVYLQIRLNLLLLVKPGEFYFMDASRAMISAINQKLTLILRPSSITFITLKSWLVVPTPFSLIFFPFLCVITLLNLSLWRKRDEMLLDFAVFLVTPAGLEENQSGWTLHQCNSRINHRFHLSLPIEISK